jgi:hypothetical protein
LIAPAGFGGGDAAEAAIATPSAGREQRAVPHTGAIIKRHADRGRGIRWRR